MLNMRGLHRKDLALQKGKKGKRGANTSFWESTQTGLDSIEESAPHLAQKVKRTCHINHFPPCHMVERLPLWRPDEGFQRESMKRKRKEKLRKQQKAPHKGKGTTWEEKPLHQKRKGGSVRISVRLCTRKQNLL